MHNFDVFNIDLSIKEAELFVDGGQDTELPFRIPCGYCHKLVAFEHLHKHMESCKKIFDFKEYVLEICKCGCNAQCTFCQKDVAFDMLCEHIKKCRQSHEKNIAKGNTDSGVDCFDQ